MKRPLYIAWQQMLATIIIIGEGLPVHLEQSDLSNCLPEIQYGDLSFSSVCVCPSHKSCFSDEGISKKD